MEYLVFLQGTLIFFPLIALILSIFIALISFIFLKLFRRPTPPLSLKNFGALYIMILAGLEIYFLLSLALQALGFNPESRRYFFTLIAILFFTLAQLYNYFILKKKGN